MKYLILELSKFEYIKIISDFEIDFKEVDYCCGEVKAYFIYEQQQLCIGEKSVGLFFEALIIRLKKVIDEKLQLDKSIIQNLGFMYNRYRYQLPSISSEFIMVPTESGKSSYWIGADYKIWATRNTTDQVVTTWLYNDHQGNIIFEVTPLYKWSFLPDDLEDPDFISYDEFMKNYKPIIHRVIPRDVAIEWLKQAMKAYRELFSSEEKYQNMCKENNW